MAGFGTVPDVQSTAVRVALAAGLSERVEQLAAEAGLMRDEYVELLIRSRTDGPDSPAAALWEQYAGKVTQTPGDVVAALVAAGVTDGVRGLKLGAPAPDRVPAPWPRPGTGAELWWSPIQVWPIVRGLWRMDPTGISVIVALRLGYALGVYRVDGWGQESQSERRFALGGRVITATGRLLDAETGADVGEASTTDMTIRAAITAAPILPQSRQPVVRLSTR